jgi:hypothetical protein
MSRIKLRFVQAWVDKRDGGAVVRHYFRRRGAKRVPLPGLPGSPEFMAAYQEALAGQPSAKTGAGASRTKAGSIRALVVAYFSSPAFLTRQHINAMLAQRTRTPAAANYWLRLVKALMQYAVDEGFPPGQPDYRHQAHPDTHRRAS